MRLLFLCVSLILAFSAITPPALCQLAPPDVLEPVNVPARPLTTPEERGQAQDLLAEARRNYRSGSGGHPFTIKASFTATGATAFEGDGRFEETVGGNSHWRMTGQLAGATIVRLGSGGHTYGNSASEPVPLRLQLVWAAIFFPVPTIPSDMAMLRTASVNYKGSSLTCILLSGWVSTQPATRFYQEREACVDAETHLLRVWSEKPGIYAEYDYANSISFHGNVMARRITITEAGQPVVAIRIDSLEDPTPAEEASLKPTPDLVEASPVALPSAFPLRVPAREGFSLDSRVIVHASISATDGKVLEAEALQNTALTRAALEAVKAQHFPPNGTQREAFINVMFNLPPD